MAYISFEIRKLGKKLSEHSVQVNGVGNALIEYANVLESLKFQPSSDQPIKLEHVGWCAMDSEGSVRIISEAKLSKLAKSDEESEFRIGEDLFNAAGGSVSPSCNFKIVTVFPVGTRHF